MKIRKGFISNSSSTSFMVCFKPEPKDLSLKTFEFLLRKNGCNVQPLQLEVFRDTVKERKENLLKEQKALLKDQKFLEDKIAKYSKFRQDTKLMQKLDEIDTMIDDVEGVRYSRTIARINKNKKKEDRYFVNKFSKSFNTITNQVEKIKEKLDKINTQYSLIKDLPDISVVAKWEEDSNFSSLLKDFVDEFEADGRIIVLEKITD
jgi:hypothetical protein